MNIERILSEMPGVAKPQRKFLVLVLTVFIYLRGKANFRNLSRHSELSEKTYSRWFRREFDFVEFNRRGLGEIVENAREMVAVVDCSFCKKSGKQTYGLDKFYNSQHSKSEKGLEISTLALVDVEYNISIIFFFVLDESHLLSAKNLAKLLKCLPKKKHDSAMFVVHLFESLLIIARYRL